ncbi:MAG: hypothetical protein OEM39_07290 [Acidimicrobiia bacterium]|nr:hypothetical protein [Acidimicrobiia bacterium]MDH3463412.1 hypothetical protein [Acidimicrobiia bacterium]
MDRRVPFFAVVSAVTLGLVPFTPDRFAWVAWTVAITYAVFSLAYLLNYLSATDPSERSDR